MKRDRAIRERQRLAQYVERAAAIAAALRHETHPIDDASLKAVGRWLTDGADPFFGRDSTAAHREVVRLQHVVVGAETAVFEEERFAVAL